MYFLRTFFVFCLDYVESIRFCENKIKPFHRKISKMYRYFSIKSKNNDTLHKNGNHTVFQSAPFWEENTRTRQRCLPAFFAKKARSVPYSLITSSGW